MDGPFGCATNERMEHVVTRPTPPFTSQSGRLTVHQVPVWMDNLVWLIVDADRHAAAVDGPEAGPVLDYCTKHELRLTTIFNTHTHGDHVGINSDLEARGMLADLQVVGPRRAQEQVPGIKVAVDDGDTVTFGGVEGRVLLTEGHIDGHVSYVFEDLLFCGDTMFAAGCGYLFDGPPAKMHDSLTRLAALHPCTRVCCAHEYTQDNLRFAWSVDSENPALADRIRSAWAIRAEGGCTVPSTIGEELATNPFLRHGDPKLKKKVAAAFPDRALHSAADVFAATRALKDRKDYRSLGDDALPL